MENGLFDQLSSSAYLFTADADWNVVVADIQGSTEAVLKGRYKEVNLIGAACLAAIRNEFSAKELVYVFGGDGATFLVPTKKLDKVLELLRHVQTVSSRNLGLELRVGHLNISEVNELGGQIYYGFLEINKHEFFSYMRGNGIQIAEKEIKRKSTSNPQIIPDNSEADLVGLSCRMTPFKSQRGRIVSLIVKPLVFGEEQDKILSKLLTQLRGEDGLWKKRPVNVSNSKRHISIKNSIIEAHLLKKRNNFFSFSRAFLYAMLEGSVSYLLFTFNISLRRLGKPKAYTEALVRQSDWIKMDGDLRLVLDLNTSEEKELFGILDDLEAKEKIKYGYHASDSAVMVCHYQSGVDDKHMHFVDGKDGGLTRAAIHLKQK